MNNKEIIELSQKHVLETYKRAPVAFIKGEGAKLWDADGKEYLDFVSGLAVCNLGHCHKKVVEALKAQSETLIHTSNLYYIANSAELASLLCQYSFGERVFFCNSGSEANEAAIKLARKYFSSRGEKRNEIVSMEKSFHGRTMAAMAATGQVKIQEGFEPLLQKFVYVPFNDLEAAKAAVNKNTAAFMIEPVQGEGGVNVPTIEYMQGLRKLCDEKGILLIIDEVQTGMGRTGKLFGYEHYNIKPDIMTLAKGLAGGVAIGAMVTTNNIAQSFGPGSHGSTFGGNPLATSAASAALRAIIDEGVVENAEKIGVYLMTKLNELKSQFPFINEVRGKGLICALGLDFEGAEIVGKCLEKGLIINCTNNTVLRFLPPLIIGEKEVDSMISTLKTVLKEVKG